MQIEARFRFHIAFTSCEPQAPQITYEVCCVFKSVPGSNAEYNENIKVPLTGE